MKKNPKIFLEHILESINEIERNISKLSKKEFLKNTTTQDAVIRRLEIIGEAVKNLPPVYKNKYKNSAWKHIAGLRDILIHEYFGVDIDLVWKISIKDIPDLKKKILKLKKEY